MGNDSKLLEDESQRNIADIRQVVVSHFEPGCSVESVTAAREDGWATSMFIRARA